MTLLSFLSAGTVHDIGWTLLHFFWQGLLLAAALELILSFVRSASARHNWALAALVLMMLAPVVTFLFLHGQGLALDGTGTELTAPTGAGAPLELIATSAAPSLWINWMVLLWMSGIAALSLRALGGWVLVESLRRRDTQMLSADLMERCRALQQKLQVMRPVRFLQSLRVSVPVVVGWFRPVILIPVSALAGLPPQQLDALILHELAHIRRHDALINALLLVAETVLFYQPAVWWVSRRIRIERENCCDDLAVARCGDAALYVEALASLEAGRLPPGLALAAGGRLKDRAARLLGVPSQTRRYSLGGITGLAAVTLIAVSAALAQPGPVAPADVSAASDRVAQIDFIGNKAFDANTLRAQIQEAERLVPALSTNDDRLAYYHEALRHFYVNRGYADFKVDALTQLAPGGRPFHITFTVDEGKQYRFGEVSIKSQIAELPQAELMQLLSFKSGDLYDQSQLQKALDAVIYAAGTKGYAFAHFGPPVLRDPNGKPIINVVINLDQGPRVTIRHIVVSGTQRAAVLSYIAPLREGDLYDIARINAARERLRATGQFSNLTFTFDPTATLTIRVVKDPPMLFPQLPN